MTTKDDGAVGEVTQAPRPPLSPKERVIPRTRPGLWTATGVTVLLLALGLFSIATNRRFQWHVVGGYLFDPMILDGLVMTVVLTVVAMAIGISLGVVLAFMRFSDSRFLVTVSAGYAWLFRSVPALVQILIWFNLAALYPRLSVGVPFGPEFFSASTNDLITPLAAAILGLGLNQAAYTGEVIRGGMLSVGRGQSEAARALGMSERRRLGWIVLPQAMKAILPPVGNEVIGMLKNTSLVSVIAVADLLYSAQIIYSRTYQVIPLLMVACVWYLVATSILSIGQHFIERRFNRGS
jgi:polar amino acid transport system permease protein